RHCFRRFAALLDYTLVLFLELKLVDLIAPEQRRIAGIGDLHLAQHLAHDDLDMFVINLDTLQSINFLHFVDQVLLQILRPAHFQNFVRYYWTLGHLLAFLHEIAFEHDDVFRERDQMLFFRFGLWVLQNKPPFSADRATHLDNAVDLRDLRGILRPARLEQFRHPRQTTGDIFRLRYFARSFREQGAGPNLLALLHDDVRARRNRVTGEDFLLLAHNDNLRMQILLVFDDDRAHQARRFVDIALNGYARDHIAELNFAAFISKNRNVVRIPLHEGLAFFHFGAVRFGNNRANHDIVAFELAPFGIVHADGTVLIQYNPAAIECLDCTKVVKLKMTIILRLDNRLLESLACSSADVERPHC